MYFVSLQIYASTVKLLDDKQLETLGICVMGDRANLRAMRHETLSSDVM